MENNLYEAFFCLNRIIKKTYKINKIRLIKGIIINLDKNYSL